MTNIQIRLLASAIVMVAGALAASSTTLGSIIMLLSGALFIAEYVGSYQEKK